jgi:hypothetical protein
VNGRCDQWRIYQDQEQRESQTDFAQLPQLHLRIVNSPLLQSSDTPFRVLSLDAVCQTLVAAQNPELRTSDGGLKFPALTIKRKS